MFSISYRVFGRLERYYDAESHVQVEEYGKNVLMVFPASPFPSAAKRLKLIKNNFSLPDYLLLTWARKAHGTAGFGAPGVLEGFHGISAIANKLGPGVC